LAPEYAEAYINRGVAYAEIGKHEQAIRDYDKAIELDPEDADAYYNRGVVYYAEREYDKAWEDVRKVQSLGLQVNPRFLKALREASGRQR